LVIAGFNLTTSDRLRIIVASESCASGATPYPMDPTIFDYTLMGGDLANAFMAIVSSVPQLGGSWRVCYEYDGSPGGYVDLGTFTSAGPVNYTASDEYTYGRTCLDFTGVQLDLSGPDSVAILPATSSCSDLNWQSFDPTNVPYLGPTNRPTSSGSTASPPAQYCATLPLRVRQPAIRVPLFLPHHKRTPVSSSSRLRTRLQPLVAYVMTLGLTDSGSVVNSSCVISSKAL